MMYCETCREGIYECVVGTVSDYMKKVESSRHPQPLPEVEVTVVEMAPAEPEVLSSMWDLVGSRRAPTMWEAFCT